MSCFSCCWPASSLRSRSHDPDFGKGGIENVLNKTEDAMCKEYGEIRNQERLDRYPSYQTEIKLSGFPYLWANLCLNGTLILCEAPKIKNFETFRELLYTECDAVITLMQSFDFQWHQDCLPYFNPLAGALHLSASIPFPALYLPHAIVRSILTVSAKEADAPARKIPHYHYNEWEDGRGTDANNLARLVRLALRYQKPLIHCFAGVGRAGTLAATISAYRQILAGNVSPNLVKQAVYDLRRERSGAVSSEEQYVSIYGALRILVEEGAEIPSLSVIMEEKENEE